MDPIMFIFWLGLAFWAGMIFESFSKSAKESRTTRQPDREDVG